MPVERRRVELGQAVDLVDPGVDAVGDRDVDEAVVGAERDRRLGALLGERVQPASGSASQDDGCAAAQRRLSAQLTVLDGAAAQRRLSVQLTVLNGAAAWRWLSVKLTALNGAG